MQCIETKTHQANHPMEEIIKEKSYSAAGKNKLKHLKTFFY